MKIITISRECGSGGRTLGKLLADSLQADFFDRDTITAMTHTQKLAAEPADCPLESTDHRLVPVSGIAALAGLPVLSHHTESILEQQQTIEQIPTRSSHCVIVGRNAAYLLRRYHPFKVFVCADIAAKLQRCREWAPSGETLADRDLERKLRQMDKARRETCNLLAGEDWGNPKNYHLVVNTTQWNLPELVPMLADFARKWFDKIP